jgi:hypothetical protein
VKFKLAIVLLLLVLTPVAFGTSSKGLPFINDDYERALAQAKQRNLPLFVEVWAPW